MTHGVRFFARNSSFGTIAFRFNSRVRRLLRSLLRTAAATFRIGVSRDGVSIAASCSPVREHRHLFWRLCHNVGGLSALPDDADVALGMGLECIGRCRVLLVISIGMAIIFRFRIAKPLFPATLAEFQKDREWLKHTIKSSR